MESVGSSAGASPAGPRPSATRLQLEQAKRKDNFLKSVGENAVWAMGATALDTYLQNSELMTRKPYCEALLEKMRGATGLDLVSTDACLEEHAQPPWAVSYTHLTLPTTPYV